jgi:hypothetical protein
MHIDTSSMKSLINHIIINIHKNHAIVLPFIPYISMYHAMVKYIWVGLAPTEEFNLACLDS